jgi:CHRD domain
MKTNRNSFKYPFILTGKILMLKQIQFIVLAGVLVIAGSCKKDTVDPNVKFMATINGASETPANASAATGTATLTFNKDTKLFSIVVNFSGITATSAHIHKGDVGVAGGIIFGFTAPITSPINYTSVALDATQEADLNANMYYVNIHSAAFPAGEIRGQLIKQ